jgi:hypothetical protein
MSDFRENVFARAFRTIPGVAYNQALQELSLKKDIVYEVVLPEHGSWRQFRDRTYPSFVRHLKYKAIDMENPKGVTVAVFFKEACYLVEAEEFLKLLREMDDLNPAAFQIRVLQWLAD